MSFEASHAEMRRVYHETISRLQLPPTVIASKKTPDGRVLEGSQIDIHHNHWGVRQIVGRGDEKILWFDFDNVIDFGGVRLTDPRRKLDYLTKKVFVLSGLGATGSKPTTPLLVIQRARQYDLFVRWRLSQGIEHNEHLTKDHFDIWCGTVSGDPLYFLPILERLDTLFEAIIGGKVDINQFYKEDAGNHRQYFDWPRMADTLGTTKAHLSTLRTFVTELVDRLGSINHPVVPRLIASLGRRDERLDREDYAESSVEKLLYPWGKLYRLAVEGTLTSGVLTFNAFEKRSPGQIVKSLQLRQGERTSNLEPDDFVRLLKEAAKWVFEYSDYICEAVDARRSHNRGTITAHGKRFVSRIDPLRPEGAPKLHHGWTVFDVPESEADERLSLGSAVKHLLASCAIIIGCFSARRGGEIQMLRSNCITQVGAHHYLTVYIEKTLQGIDKIPVPQMVAAAIEILNHLTRGDGNDMAETALFNFFKQTSRVGFQFTYNMKDFVDYTGLRPSNPDTEWNLASHQLRRGFAIYYYYGFEWADLDSLAYMLRHYDPEMTRVYITEAVAGEITVLEDELRARSAVAKEKHSKALQIWIDKSKAQIADLRNLIEEYDDVRMGAYVRRMISQHKNTDRAIGRGVARLKLDLEAMVNAAAADVRITSATNDEGKFLDALEKRLKTQAFNRFLEPVPGGVAHCTANLNGGDDLSLAECNKLSVAAKSPDAETQIGRCSKVDVAFSGISPCLDCIYGVLFQANQRIVEQQLATEEVAIETAQNETERERRRANLERRREKLRARQQEAETA